MLLEIERTGLLMNLQDDGRSGWRRFGVPAAGAMDRAAMSMANTLLGNTAEVPVLEVAHLGARIRVLKDTWLSIAGADHCSGLAAGTARRFKAGELLEWDQRSTAVFSYLAVPGGFDSEQWFGSACSDPRNGLGRPLRTGAILDSLGGINESGVARRLSTEPLSSISGETHFEMFPGPQFDLIREKSRALLADSTWTVSTQSDRTGYRLNGPAITAAPMTSSEPVLPGSFQIPGNGLPIVTMHDGPTVGGYVKLAVLKSSDLDRFAQCAPGTKITFSWLQSS
jgi:biotin-dependent carboxylase-like uncharacterized protein